MAYWLMKSEPSEFSWQRLVKDGKGMWDGVRNYTARNNMMAMKVGDRAFFYHSNVTPGYVSKAVVGIMEIFREHRPDPTDETGKFVVVDVKPVEEMQVPVTLADIKANAKLSEMKLIRQSRLSVSPVSAAEWKVICGMGGLVE